ncbi:carbohydrate kinase [Pararhizobium sp. IMCC21322]|uniref:carbohydrate kinase family protein n=1 Tax=Pararhizobium sp. IMCC21322 TaxID=3067903 RepID=UPI002740CD34|nr:carbohydrate kinase [Pararhizobium sp. IMCC21322]
MPKLHICGEALIDFVPFEGAEGQVGYTPKPGGSPYNAAKAAARAGADVSFLGAISTDFFGDQLKSHLEESGVYCDALPRCKHPTTLAFVDLTSGDPRYAFYNNETSTANMAPDPTMVEVGPGDILDVGSISLIDLPGADNITDFTVAMSDRMMISIDPNARPGMIENWSAWHKRIARLLEVASIIKLSVEDLNIIAPHQTAVQFAKTCLAKSAGLVVITDGGEGATGYTGAATVKVKTPRIVLADTVGAGDTLMGSTLAWLLDQGLSDAEALRSLNEDALKNMLEFATSAAAINCQSVGCNPPTRAEIEAFLADGL